MLGAFDEAALEAPARDSEDYVVPDAATLEAVENAARAVATGRYTDALAFADDAEHRLCRGQSAAEAELILLAPVRADIGWARASLRRGVASPWIIGAPHPMFEINTRPQAIGLYADLEARALIVSGTHRCANSEAVVCDGTTGVCGGSSQPYPVSDPAHDTESTFHRMHVGFADAFEDAVVVSVHGMARDGVSLSNGTSSPVAADSPVARLAAGLVAEGVEDVTACNDGAGVPRELHLCGGTNVQGRYVNGSPEACTERAPAATDRFIHIEQSRAVRDAPDRVQAAFERAQ